MATMTWPILTGDANTPGSIANWMNKSSIGSGANSAALGAKKAA